MTIAEIVALPLEQRLEAFIELWLDLAEHIGCRTYAEQTAMAEIADAILPTLIREHKHSRDARAALVSP